MQRKFLANLALIILVNLLVKPLYLFGIDRGVQNTVGSADYGLFYALFNLCYIFSIIPDLGITNYNNRHIAQHSQLLTKYFSNITVIKIFLSLIYIFIVLLLAFYRGYSERELNLLIILLTGQVLNSYVLYNRSNLAGLHLFKTDTFISVLDKVLLLLFCGPLLLLPVFEVDFSIETFIYLQSGSFLITAIVSFFLVKQYTDKPSFKFDLNMLRVILKESYPYAILTLLMTVYMKIDTVLLKELHPDGYNEVGIYAAAYRLVDALNMIAVLFAGLLYPIFARMIKQQEDLNPLIRTGISLLVLPAVIFAVCAYFYRFQIMDLLYKEHAEASAGVFGSLMISFIAICSSYIFGTLLTAKGNIKLLNTIALLAVVLNVLCNYLIIPTMGAKGAAWVSLSTFSLVAILHAYYSFKHFKLNYNFGGITKFLVIGILCFCLGYIGQYTHIHWILAFTGNIIIGLSLLILTKLVPVRDFFNIFKAQKSV